MYSFYLSFASFVVMVFCAQRWHHSSKFLRRYNVTRTQSVLYCGVLSCYVLIFLVIPAQINLPRMEFEKTSDLVAMSVVDTSKGTYVVDAMANSDAGFYINVKNADGTASLIHIFEGEPVEVHEEFDRNATGIWKRTVTVHDCSSWLTHWTLPCHLDEEVVKNELYVPSKTVAYQFVLRATSRSRD